MASGKRLRRRRRQFNGKGLMAVRLAFARKFGRLPRGTDPVFFDPDADQPNSLSLGSTQRLVLEAMLEKGTAPHIVYAYCCTGFHISEIMRSALPSERLSRWDMAVGEYLAFGDKANNTQH